jgi:hypothetical protein
LIIKQGAIVDASIVESSRRPRKTQTIEEVGSIKGVRSLFIVLTRSTSRT